MAGPQIVRTCDWSATVGAPCFVIHLSHGGPLLFGARLWPERDISVVRPPRGWHAPEPEELALLDATPAGRAWRVKVEGGRS